MVVATLPWVDAPPTVVMDGEAISAVEREYDMDWGSRVQSFEVTVYFHSAGVTALPGDGIEAYPVYVILAKRRKKWHLDSIDLTAIHAVCGARSYLMATQSAFRAAAIEMSKRGINPLEIIGWAKYTQNWDYRATLEEAWLTRGNNA